MSKDCDLKDEFFRKQTILFVWLIWFNYLFRVNRLFRLVGIAIEFPETPYSKRRYSFDTAAGCTARFRHLANDFRHTQLACRNGTKTLPPRLQDTNAYVQYTRLLQKGGTETVDKNCAMSTREQPRSSKTSAHTRTHARTHARMHARAHMEMIKYISMQKSISINVCLAY